MFSLVLLMTSFAVALTPDGPTSIDIGTSTEKQLLNSEMVNVSGGTITPVNLSATIQNPRWKAFVGSVTGSFTLDDASGNSIYDWSLSTVTGRVYATRTSGSVTWSNVACATPAQILQENTELSHSSPNDNISATFSSTTHDQFYVGSVNIAQDSCKSLNTYVNGASQDASFEEMLLHDQTNMVYTTILEEDLAGYNGQLYDFQMLVPEVGSSGWTGSTAYYLYVEIGN